MIFREELIARDATEGAFTLLLRLSRDTARRPQDAGRRVDAPLLEDTLARLGAVPRLTFAALTLSWKLSPVIFWTWAWTRRPSAPNGLVVSRPGRSFGHQNK